MRRSIAVQLLVVGSAGSARSEIGLSLARLLHRPFLDSSDPAVIGTADPGSNGPSELDRVERLLAMSTASVIAAPRVVLSPNRHEGRRDRTAPLRWTVLLDDSKASDHEASDIVDDELVDAVMASTLPIDESALARLVEEFRDASRRTPG